MMDGATRKYAVTMPVFFVHFFPGVGRELKFPQYSAVTITLKVLIVESHI